MRGAIIFLGAFAIFLIITLGYAELPPGLAVYNAIVGADYVDYPILGIPATTLIAAVFNGVIYGVIIWLIYTLAEKAGIIPSKKTTLVVEAK